MLGGGAGTTPGNCGDPGPVFEGPQPFLVTSPSRSLEIPPLILQGVGYTVRYTGLPGDIPFFLLGVQPFPIYTLGCSGLLIDANPIVSPLPMVGPDGAGELLLDIANLGPNFDAAPVFAQVNFVSLDGTCNVSSVRVPTVVRCSANLPTDQDCNGNGVRDLCDIASGTSQDADRDGIPDECRP